MDGPERRTKLRLTVHSAQNLDKKDFFKLPDPFAKITVDGSGRYHSTEVVKGTLDPKWNQHYNLFLSRSDSVTVSIWNHKNVNRKERAGFLGCVTLTPSAVIRLKDTGYMSIRTNTNQRLNLGKNILDDEDIVRGQLILSLTSQDATSLPATIATTITNVEELPERWECRRTPHGRRYYINQYTRTTQWERPTCEGLARELHQAVEAGQNLRVNSSLQKGADPNHQLYWSDEWILKSKYPPLHHACKEGYLDIVIMLLNGGADLYKSDRINTAPLHWVCRGGHKQVVEYLIKEAGCNADVRDGNGRTPLHYACQSGNRDLVQYLVEEVKCDVDVRDGNGKTPLHDACQSRNRDLVQYLVKEVKCDVDVMDEANSTPLHYACNKGHKEVVRYLVEEANCDINVRDKYNQTPLHYACNNGHKEVVRYLVEKANCDINVRNKNNWTPLHNACFYGHNEVVRYLVEEANCDINVNSIYDETPCDMAARRGHTEIADYLKSVSSERSHRGEKGTSSENKDSSQHTSEHNASQAESAHSVSHNVTETPSTIPLFLKQPKNVMAKPGSDVMFSIKFSIAATYNWYFEEQQIFSERTDYGGSTTDSLAITKCLPKHKGAYKCITTDKFGRTFTSESATLQIDGEEIQKGEAKLLGEILRKANISLVAYGVDVEQLAQGKCKHTYEEMQYVLRSNPAKYVLSLNLKEELTSRLKEERLYKEALAADQKVTLSYTKILALGPSQVGKSTFLYRLLGLMKGNIQTADPKTQPQCSTGVAELREACITYTCRTGAITSESWEVFDESFNLQCQLEGLMSLIVEQTASETQQTPALKKKEPLACKNDASAKVKKVFNYIKGMFQKLRPKFVGVRIEIFDPPSSQLASDPCDLLPSESLPRTPYLPHELSNIDKILIEFESIKKECMLALSKTKFRMLFNIADIGGQPAFLEMLPSLTIGPAMYLVFMKLLQGLTTQYPVVYKCKDERGSKLCKNYTYTSEEVIFTALSSIACFGNSDNEVEQYVTSTIDKKQTNSLALLIGTFKDKMKDEKSLEDIDHNLQQKLELTDFFSDGLIHSKSFLHVDNFSAPQTELKYHRKLLQEILDKKFRKYDIPTRWLTLSICLKLLARLENKHEVSFDDCVELGSRLSMSKEMVKIALQFLHKYIGLIMYFPKNNFLQDTVICDPQVVFSSISELIFDIYDPRKMYVTEAQHDHFVRTGCFSPQDIKTVEDEKTAKKHLPIDALVHLLVHLNIIAEVPANLGEQKDSLTESELDASLSPKKYYFLPAVLQTAVLTPMSRGANEEQLPEPLCIGFKTGYLPLGFACALSANLIAESNFELIPFEVHCQQIAYKNKIMFRFQGRYDIIMTSGLKYCELQVTKCSEGAVEYWDSECCPCIKTIICEAADRVIQSMQHGSLYKLSKSYELAFKCPNHADPEIGHEPLAKIVYDSSLGMPIEIVCVDSSCKLSTHLSPEMKMWFGEAIQTVPLNISRGTFVLSNKIKIQAEGTKPLKYKWFKDNEELSDSDDYEGVTTTELAILGTGSGLKGKYKCQVHNKYGEIFSKDVLYDPFVRELKDKGLEDGEISKLIDNGVGNLEELKNITKDNVKIFNFNFGEEIRVMTLLSSFNHDSFTGYNQSLQTERKNVNSYADTLKGPTVVLTVATHLQRVKELIWSARVLWSALAGALGVSHDTVEEIRHDLHCRNDGDRLERVLIDWMSGEAVTICHLMRALDNPTVNLGDLSRHLLELGVSESNEENTLLSPHGARKTVILEKLMKVHNMSSEQLECEIEEGDITYLAVYFDNVESYFSAMQLTESEQIEVRKIQDNETAVCQCLSFWRRSKSTTAATLKTLLEILVSLSKDKIASRVCNFYYPKQK